MSEFTLDPRLKADSMPVLDLPLCSLRLMNDQRFPWLLLIPRRSGMEEILDLSREDQQQLWVEIRQVTRAMQALLAPDKLNVAALGNQVRQLHVHVIARYQDDDAWPAPVWGVGSPVDYGAESPLIDRFRAALDSG
ncbi:MAG: HIT family protein [Pseudomonadota bacterium]